MRNTRIALGLLAALSASPALAQSAVYPQTIPANTVIGRLGGTIAGPAQAIPFTRLGLIPTTAPVLGVVNSISGSIGLAGITSGKITITVNAVAGTWTMKLPATPGLNGQSLVTDGSGNLSWATGTGTVNSGAAGQLGYYATSAAALSGNSNLNVSGGALTIGVAGSQAGTLLLAGSSSGATTLAGQTSGGGTMTFPAGSDTVMTLAATQTATNKTFTSPTINTPTVTGGTLAALTGLGIRDSSAAFDVTLAAGSGSATLTAGRTLTFDVGNVAHTVQFGTTAGTIIFPNTASDTVAMLAASQAISNKTITASTYNGLTITSTTGTLTIAAGKTLTDTSTAGTNILLGATGGGFAAYGGSGCTNQVLTALSSAGSASCNSITNAFLTAGTFSSITGVGTLTSGAIGSGFTAIPNSALANSGVTIGTTSVSLGGTAGTVAGLTLTTLNVTGAGVVGGNLSFGTLDPTSLGNSPTTITGLTTNNSPSAGNDYIPYYSASAGKIVRATVASIAAGATAGVGSLNGLTGGLSIVAGSGLSVAAAGTSITLSTTSNLSFGGRLTLISGQPEMTTDVVGGQNVYYAPDPGGAVPIYNGTNVQSYCFLQSSCSITDQVGLTLALGGSASWPANTIYDVFVTLNSGVPVLATRAWDGSMLPSAPAQVANNAAISTGTTPVAWTNPVGNAFNGTVNQASGNSATIVSNNSGANCLGQDFGSGNPQVVSQIVVTAPTDNPIRSDAPTYLPVTAFGSPDNTNWTLIDQRNINGSATNAQYILGINNSMTVPYRYVRFCVAGNASNSPIRIGQVQFYTTAGLSTRRLIKYGGMLTNDATISAAQINSTTTISIPANQGTYLGSFQTDAGSAGKVSAYVTPGPSRVYNIWNAEHQRTITLRAMVPFTVTGVGPNNYNLTSTSYAAVQGTTTFSFTALIGYAYEPFNVVMTRSAYMSTTSAGAGYTAGIGLDSINNISGLEVSFTTDSTGQAQGFQASAYLTMQPFSGSHTFYGVEYLAYSPAGSLSIFTNILNTQLSATWKG